MSLDTVTQGWNIQNWDLKKHLPLEKAGSKVLSKYKLSEAEIKWIDAWAEFVEIIKRRSGEKALPGFPIWADEWVETSKLRVPSGTPDWKAVFLRKNSELYTSFKEDLDAWLKKWNNLEDFPPSRRKFEWQAQDAAKLWDCIMHFRPSGIRAKKATYVPALVAITQTTIIGPQRRRLSVREGARLQGLPEWFSFDGQNDAASYKQLGNGVNIPAVYHVMRALVQRDLDLLGDSPELVKAILNAPPNPEAGLEKLTKKRE